MKKHETLKTFKLVGVLVLPTIEEVILEQTASSEVTMVIPVYKKEENLKRKLKDDTYYIQMTDENEKTKFEKIRENSFISKGKIELLPEEDCVAGLTENDVYYGFKYGEGEYCIGTIEKVKNFLKNYDFSNENEILKSEIKEFIEEF